MDSTEFQTTFDTDEYIFKEGDPGDCAYIIDFGMVEVSLDKDGRQARENQIRDHGEPVD